MPADSRTTKSTDPILVLGTGAFIEKRLLCVLQLAGFSVERQLRSASRYALGIVRLPAGEELEALMEARIPLLAAAADVEQLDRLSTRWPFSGILHADMSTETIVQMVNEVMFRHLRADRPPRHSVQLLVQVRGDERIVQSYTVDISRGGLFVRSLNPFAPDTNVALRLLEGEDTGELQGRVVYTIGAQGDRIVRHGPDGHPVAAHPGMAVQLEPNQEETIGRWLEYVRSRLTSSEAEVID